MQRKQIVKQVSGESQHGLYLLERICRGTALRVARQQCLGLFGKMVNISLRRCQIGTFKAQKII
jgi:hypothetical protein